MQTPSARLQAKLALAYPWFSAQARPLWESPSIRELYPRYLGFMHMIVRSAVPLMQAAIDEALALGPDDPLASALARYLSRHQREEAGHDAWLLEDLAVTGWDPEVVRRTIPPVSVASMVGAQYYWIRHFHPVALLGHLAAIESFPPPAGFAQQLAAATGYPRAAFRAIARHEVLDIAHRAEFYALLDTLPLTPQQEKLIGISSLHTLSAGMEVLQDVLAVPAHAPPADQAPRASAPVS